MFIYCRGCTKLFIILLLFQAATGIDDIEQCIVTLEQTDWDLTVSQTVVLVRLIANRIQFLPSRIYIH